MPAESATNRLLDLLDDEARHALLPTPVQLRAREVLYEPGTPALFAFFPESAVISLVSTMEDGACSEAALIGRDGMVGLAGVFGTVEGTTAAVVQMPGSALKVPIATLRQQRLRSAPVRAVLDLYTEARLIQVAQTAACNRLHTIEARLARWLLTISDRPGADYFTLPQEFIAQMLGVHRPTVSLTMQRLRDRGIIAIRGRAMAVADRKALEQSACECYSVVHREFDRLLTPPLRGLAPAASVLARPAAPGHESEATLEALREISGRLLLATIREQEARDEAEAANRVKDQFLATVSHELRTPLNAIVGWAAILQDRPDVSRERGLAVIERNAQALLRLVEELLDVSGGSANTITMRTSAVDLRDVVCRAVDAVRPGADTKGVALRAAVPEMLPPITGDADRLRQVFLNVLGNGLKFTDPGGAIDVSAQVTGSSARVSIHDSGRGIAADELPHVFERFRQGADATDGQHGLGLGLTIARSVVELHHGRIEVFSPGLGQGTTCTIELPIGAVAPTAVA